MSYLALARKYRPSNFGSLVGQSHVVQALTHALERNTLHHAYLFTGTRGVGKTTIARILATGLNCEQGPTPVPCGVCTACQEIQGGHFADLIELDAATNTSVNDMRHLLDSAIYAPTSGRYKVYVIDEVHMLSTSAFNAMLKTLEEPPEHLKFVLATTDPQKIPVTVLSRCLQLNLKPLSPSLIAEQLGRILKEEGVEAEATALHLLAKSAKGSMRDALSLLDQAIVHSGGCIQESHVRDMLGLVNDEVIYRLLEQLAAKNADALMGEIEQIEAAGLSPEGILEEMAVAISRIAMFQMAPQMAEGADDSASLAPFQTAFDPETLQLMYQICIYGKRDLVWAPNEYAGLAMTLVRLLAFHPVEEIGKASVAAERASDPKKGLNEGVASAVSETSLGPMGRKETKVSNEKVADTKAEPDVRSEPIGVDDFLFPAADSLLLSPQTQAQPVSEREIDRPLSPAADSPLSQSEGELTWHRMIDQMRLSGPAKLLAENCEWVGDDGQIVTLRLTKDQERRKTALTVSKLEAGIAKVVGRDSVKVVFEIGSPTSTTYSEVKSQAKAEAHRATVESIQSDPYVQQLIDLFEGDIDHQTIQAITSSEKE